MGFGKHAKEDVQEDWLTQCFSTALQHIENRNILLRRKLLDGKAYAAMWPHDGHLIHPSVFMALEGLDLFNVETGTFINTGE